MHDFKPAVPEPSSPSAGSGILASLKRRRDNEAVNLDNEDDSEGSDERMTPLERQMKKAASLMAQPKAKVRPGGGGQGEKIDCDKLLKETRTCDAEFKHAMAMKDVADEQMKALIGRLESKNKALWSELWLHLKKLLS